MSVAEKYLEGLHALVRQTDEVVSAADAGEWDAVLAGLDQRQALMAAIDQLALGPAQMSPQQQAEANRLLERMVSLNQELSHKVAVSLGNIRSAMDETRRAHSTVSAYRKILSPSAQALPSRFMDKQR